MQKSVPTDQPSWFAGLSALARRAAASDFFRKVAETLATRVVLIGIGLLTTVIVARILGPEGRGLYAVAITVGAIGVQFANLGLHSSNTYYSAQNSQLLPTLLTNTLFFSLIMGGFSGLGTLAVFAVCPQWAPVHGLLLILALLWIPFGLGYLLLQSLLLGTHQIRVYNTIELTTKTVTIVLFGILFFSNRISVEAVFFAGLLAMVIGFAWAALRLRPPARALPRPSLELFKTSIHYGIKAYLASLFSFLLLRISLLTVQYKLGAEQTGYYSIAATMADMIYMLPVVVGTLLFPKLSTLDHIDKKWKMTKNILGPMTGIMLVLLVLSVFLAAPAVALLFKKEFLPAVPAYIWLTPGILFLSIGTIFQNFLGASGNTTAMIYGPLVASGVNLVLNLYLVPKLGTIGASISTSCSYLIFVLVNSLLAIREVHHQSDSGQIRN